jgi:ubiquinone biosynthesis protein UbiJ
MSFAYIIQSDGSLCSVEAAGTADARCIIPFTLLPRLAMKDEKAYAEIRTEGDSALLTEIFYLSRNIRWNIAMDIGRLTGEDRAERIVQFGQEQKEKLDNTFANLARMAGDYLTEEHPVLAGKDQVSEFIGQVDKLRDDVARLEQRIEHLKASQG